MKKLHRRVLVAFVLAVLALGTMPVSAFALPEDPGYDRASAAF